MRNFLPCWSSWAAWSGWPGYWGRPQGCAVSITFPRVDVATRVTEVVAMVARWGPGKLQPIKLAKSHSGPLQYSFHAYTGNLNILFMSIFNAWLLLLW